MKAQAVVYSCIAGFAVAAPSPVVLEKFEQFRSKWGHSYVGIEYQKRATYFEKTLQSIEHLRQTERGTAVYSHLAPFADSSPEEMAQRFGFVKSGIVEQIVRAPLLNVSAPAALDWVEKGCVNRIQNQGSCGSCWAFSTVANLEGTACASHGRLVKLSEQNLVDCDKDDNGCGGGDEATAMRWSSQNGGIASEQSYPYTGRGGTCRRDIKKLVQNKGAQSISKNEDQIAQALSTYGPLSVAVDANGFNGYSGGVMRNPSCSKYSLNHAINLVGYGVDRVPYFKLRNSWGSNWGEHGYIRVYRGDCTCGVCTEVVTATGVTISGAGPGPAPPGPSPPGPSPPPSCHDSSSWCPSSPNWECRWMVSSCLKSCGCCGGGNPSSYCPSPSPPGPSPTPPGPSPTPPGPAPCVTCEWNSQCPSGQDCYYSSNSASSGCCAASPPFKNDYDYDELTNQTVVV